MANLRARVRAAAKAAVGIFSDQSGREAYGLLGGLWPSATGDPPTPGARERVGAFADMPWLHALADKVASSFAAVEWTLSYPRSAGPEGRAYRLKAAQRAYGQARRRELLRGLPAGAEVVDAPEDHPMREALGGGNALMTGLAVRYVSSLHWVLEGEAFWLKGRNGVGAPFSVWPPPPHWVLETPTPSRPAYRVGFRGWHGLIPETEILWLPRHNPANPYGRGTGLARALADELETDEYAARHTRQTFLNQARPDFIVYPGEEGKGWTDVERRRIEQDWQDQHQGFWRAFRARFATRKLGIYEFQASDMRSLQMVQLREFQRDTVRQTFGIPPEVMGIIEPGSSRATAKVSSYLFARWVLVPHLEMFRALLQERLAPEYDDRLLVDYVSPIEEDDEFNLQTRLAAPWAWSANEWRALGGSPEMEGGRGAVHVLPLGSQVVRDLTPQAPPAPGPSEPPEEPPSEEPAEDERAAMRWLGRALRARP